MRHASYTYTNVRFEVEVSTVREDGVVMNKQAEDFLDRCHEFGLGKGDLGREFRWEDKVLRVVGLRPRAKQAVLCEQTSPPQEGLVRVDAALARQQLATPIPSRPSEVPRLRLLGDREGEIGS